MRNSFIRIFLSLFLIFSYSGLVFSQSAAILPPAKTTFFDANGKPLTSGKVDFYIPGTTTRKTTWQDVDQTIPNTNPVILDAAGRALIWGSGAYRQVIKDRNNQPVWDQVTSSVGSGGSGSTVGDGDLVGTIKPWAGLIAPNQYVFAYGQELARATFPELFTAITLIQSVFCTSSSPTLSGLADTTQISVGSKVEASCVPPGSVVLSKTSSTVVVSNNANVSINIQATFFPWGNGNGSTTFNMPDLRGVTLAGRPNMGGTDKGNLTTTYYLTNPLGLGQIGGSESQTLLSTQMPSHTHTATVTDPGHIHTMAALRTNAVGGSSAPGGDSGAVQNTNLNTTGITVSNSSTGGGLPHSIIQPTITTNYIIKVSPDTASSVAGGVASLGGMTGVIACGTAILCTGNIISFNGGALSGGSTGSIQYRNADGSFGGSLNALFISPNNLTLGAAGTSFLFDIFGSTSGRVRQTVPAISGTTNILWGNNSGTPAVTASLPIVLNTTTGDLTCPTCATSTLNGAALTKVDDTNVTLTLGGTPATALLNASSLTLGWTGQLGLTRGGTAASLTASNGGIVYSGASALAILSGTATVRLPLLSGASTAPTWATISYPATAISGGIPYFSSTSAITSSALLTANAITLGGGAGAAPVSLGSLGTTTTVLKGNAAGAPTFGAVVLSTDVSGNLPNANLASQIANTVLGALTATTPSGLAVPSCSSAANALTWTSGVGFGCNSISGSGTVNSGTANQMAYYATTSTAVSGNANATISSGAFTLGQTGSVGGSLILSGATSGTATIRVATAAGTGTIFELPATNGTNNYVLQTNGSGVTSWVPLAGGTTTIASGAKALTASAISSATCTSAQTDVATGAATTDAIIVSFNSDPTAVTGYIPATTGMLTIIPYPTLNTVNFKVCNNTASSITPGAITINWRIVR